MRRNTNDLIAARTRQLATLFWALVDAASVTYLLTSVL